MVYLVFAYEILIILKNYRFLVGSPLSQIKLRVYVETCIYLLEISKYLTVFIISRICWLSILTESDEAKGAGGESLKAG